MISVNVGHSKIRKQIAEKIGISKKESFYCFKKASKFNALLNSKITH